jgi:hypothetical protein
MKVNTAMQPVASVGEPIGFGADEQIFGVNTGAGPLIPGIGM